MIDKYPLQWPIGYQRTQKRKSSNFKQTMDKVQRQLHKEVKSLGGEGLIVSSNIPIRQDGGMYSVYMNRKIDDPGVAIYFKYQEKDITMCCDQYLAVWENIYALAKGIEALRGMERWGVSNFLERAFTGFTALPESTQTKMEWYDILGVDKNCSYDELSKAYRKLVKVYHADTGNGDTDKFLEIRNAFYLAAKEINK